MNRYAVTHESIGDISLVMASSIQEALEIFEAEHDEELVGDTDDENYCFAVGDHQDYTFILRGAAYDYESINENGSPYTRKALCVGELPHDKRLNALRFATKNIGNLLKLVPSKEIPFGCPVYEAFNMRPADAKRHTHSKLLTTKGDDLSLAYC